MRIAMRMLLVVMGMCAGSLCADDAANLRPLTVDASRVTGKLRSYQGVNGGPLSMAPNGPDYGSQYRRMHIDLVRTDYFGPTEIDSKWPNPDRIAMAVGASAAKTIFPNWNADPEKAESYNFGPSDRFIQAIVDAGAEVYYRVGRTWAADPSPPPDFDKFANIVKHVAMHYNAGWAHGFHDHIRYWEFWNEPDVDRNWNPRVIRPFWTGTPAQFYTLYEKVARALKSFDPALKVGGPAKAAAMLDGPYREAFIAYCAQHRVPLDFFSWHYYHTTFDPHDMVRIGEMMRQMLDRQGLRDTEIVASEWNIGPGIVGGQGLAEGMPRSPLEMAAGVGAALLYLQDSLLARAMYYRGDAGPRPLVSNDGSLRASAYAFMAAGDLLDTPERLELQGADTIGFAAVAGRSSDARRLRVVIANYEIPPEYRTPRMGPLARAAPRPQANIAYPNNRGYALRITHLPWGNRPYEVTRRRLNGSDFPVVDRQTAQGDSAVLNNALPPPGLEEILLEVR